VSLHLTTACIRIANGRYRLVVPAAHSRVLTEESAFIRTYAGLLMIHFSDCFKDQTAYCPVEQCARLPGVPKLAMRDLNLPASLGTCDRVTQIAQN